MPIYHIPIMGTPKLLAKIAIVPLLKIQSAQKCLTFLLGRAGHGDVIYLDMPYYYYHNNNNNNSKLNILLESKYSINEVKSRVKILVDAAYFSGELHKLLGLAVDKNKGKRSELLEAIEGKEIIEINKTICAIVENTTLG